MIVSRLKSLSGNTPVVDKGTKNKFNHINQLKVAWKEMPGHMRFVVGSQIAIGLPAILGDFLINNLTNPNNSSPSLVTRTVGNLFPSVMIESLFLCQSFVSILQGSIFKALAYLTGFAMYLKNYFSNVHDLVKLSNKSRDVGLNQAEVKKGQELSANNNIINNIGLLVILVPTFLQSLSQLSGNLRSVCAEKLDLEPEYINLQNKNFKEKIHESIRLTVKNTKNEIRSLGYSIKDLINVLKNPKDNIQGTLIGKNINVENEIQLINQENIQNGKKEMNIFNKLLYRYSRSQLPLFTVLLDMSSRLIGGGLAALAYVTDKEQFQQHYTIGSPWNVNNQSSSNLLLNLSDGFVDLSLLVSFAGLLATAENPKIQKYNGSFYTNFSRLGSLAYLLSYIFREISSKTSGALQMSTCLFFWLAYSFGVININSKRALS